MRSLIDWLRRGIMGSLDLRGCRQVLAMLLEEPPRLVVLSYTGARRCVRGVLSAPKFFFFFLNWLLQGLKARATFRSRDRRRIFGLAGVVPLTLLSLRCPEQHSMLMLMQIRFWAAPRAERMHVLAQ